MDLNVRDHERLKTERESLIGQPQGALASVKTSSGLVPISASGKKIPDDKGFWCQV